jgi:type IV pilus assembly protein PilV
MIANPMIHISHPKRSFQKNQLGVFLLEALIAILVFSIGVLAMVAMGATAIGAQNDAQYRIEAASLTSDIVGQIWLNADREEKDNGFGNKLMVVKTSTLTSFAHQPITSPTDNCSFSGTPSSNPLVTTWLNRMSAGRTGLPGYTDGMAQILVDTSSTGNNKVTVTVCWKSPADSRKRRHVLTSYVN